MHQDAADKQPWHQGFADTYQEHIAPLALPVQGDLPAGLRGVLFRNGPGAMSVQGERLAHWFDGDGMVHAVRFTDAGVTYSNRFVDTSHRRAEAQAGKRLFSGFGVTARLGPLGKLRGIPFKNPANTHIIFYAQKLLALCEAGLPYRLDPATLTTIAADTCEGGLDAKIGFSAHPKIHARSGAMWNFGIAYGRASCAHLYRCDAEGRAAQMFAVPMPYNALVHDFALTDKYAVFAFAPLALPDVPWQVMLGLSPFERNLQWKPARGTHLAVVDLDGGHVRQLQAPPFFAFHTINAWDDERGDIVLDVCAYPDAGVLALLRGLTHGTMSPAEPAIPTRIVIKADNQVTYTPLSKVGLEFPRIVKSQLTTEHREVYGTAWDMDHPDFAKIPACLDTVTGAMRLAPKETGVYAGECVPVSLGDEPDDTYLLSVVSNGPAMRSEIRIYRAAELERGPMCVLPLPHALPFGFHGNWLPAGGPQVAVA